MKKENKQDLVTITCYNQTEVMERKKAIAFYQAGCDCCDPRSSEYGRYSVILVGLHNGQEIVTDEDIENY